MKPNNTPLFLVTALLLPLTSGCSAGGENSNVPSGEHSGERGEHGEESGAELALGDTYDETRHGARLMLAYDAGNNAFKGTVENTTEAVLEHVRVEVHLSNGKELGPTTPGDLGPGETREVILAAASSDFDGWSAHPEVGSNEHGHGEGGEHDRDGEHR